MGTVARLKTRTGLSNQCGPRIKERLSLLKISHSALCGRIAIATDGQWNPDRLDITNIVHGRRSVLTTELVVLAQSLDCSSAYLLGEADIPTPSIGRSEKGKEAP